MLPNDPAMLLSYICLLYTSQQMKEPYITTYAKKYRVMKERHFKQSVFFYAVKQQIISFLLDCSITY